MSRILTAAVAALESGLDEAAAAQKLRGQYRISRAAAVFHVAEAVLELVARDAPKSAVARAQRESAARVVEDEVTTFRESRSRTLDRQLVQARARETSFLRDLEQVASRCFSRRIDVRAPNWARRKAPIDRAVNLVLSDLHFGAALDPKEVPQAYGPREEARRLAWVAQQVAEYKPQYRDRTKLLVHILGDVVQNQLHDPRDGAPLAQQACSAASYLAQAVAYLSTCYKSIEVRCVPGNHGRFTSRHHGRAIHQKWDSLETVVYYCLQSSVRHLENVRVELFQTPYYVWECFGQHGFATHGCTVLNPGQPSKRIDIAALEGQIHELNDAFRQESKPACKLWVHGHTHRVYRNELGTGEIVVGNGMLVPPDPYAVSLGKLGTSCAQVLWESVPKFIAGDMRSLQVGREQDGDATLENIVRPFWGIDE